MADRIQELEKMYETGAAMMQNPTEAVYLKCKLDATLNTLSQKQTQLTQKEQLSAQLLKMVEGTFKIYFRIEREKDQYAP